MRSGPTYETKIFVAHRDNDASEFSPPTAVPEIATPGSDVPSWLSADRCRLYMTGAGEGGFSARLYVATRQVHEDD